MNTLTLGKAKVGKFVPVKLNIAGHNFGSGHVDYTLSLNDLKCNVIQLTGTADAGVNVIFNIAYTNFYVVQNNCGQTATLKNATGGTSISVANGGVAMVFNDGTNIVNADSLALESTGASLIEPALSEPAIIQKVATHDYSGGHANWTLTASERQSQVIVVTNADAAVNAIFNVDTPNFYLVYNNSGGYSLTCKNSSGATVVIPNGEISLIYNDGTDIVEINDFTSPAITQKVTTHDYAAGVSDWTLTANERKSQIIKATNASGAVNAIFNIATPNFYLVYNNTGYALTLKNVAGTTVVLQNGKHAFIYNDGTNIVLVNDVVKNAEIEQKVSTVDFLGAHADYTLVYDEYTSQTLKVTNADTAANIIFPASIQNYYLVDNQSGYAITCKVTGQTGIAVANTKRAILWCNGTDIVRITADA